MSSLQNVNRNVLGAVAIGLALVLFVSVNVLSSVSLKSARLDLTEDKIYTLSEGTRGVLTSIDEPIVMRFYLSQALLDISPAHAKYAAHVREFLENAAQLSHDMIKLEIIDPEPYSTQEDEAMGAGIQSIPLNKAGDNGYFGLLATNSTDDQQLIPFFNPARESRLEYDITKMIYDLAHPKKKVVGVITGLMMQSDPTMNRKPWTLVEQMRQFFDVRFLYGDLNKIDADVDVLMLVHPGQLSDQTLYAIDQYVLKGGKAMIFVDPHSEAMAMTASMMQQPAGDTSSDLDKLFKAWGIVYDRTKFVGDRKAAVRVGAQHAGRTVNSDYVAWLEFGKRNFDGDDILTSELERMTLAGAGSINKTDESGLKLTPLVVSSLDSTLIDADLIRLQPDPVALLQSFKPTKNSYVLAARVRGMVKSAFPEGRPKKKDAKAKDEAVKDDAAKDEATHLTESTAPTNMVIVGDADMLTDRFWLQQQNFLGQVMTVPVADNANFTLSGLENLTGDDSLIGLRSRGVSTRPFTMVEEIRKEAEARYLSAKQGLETKLRETEEKLGKVQSTDGTDAGVILTEQQKETITKFRTELIDIRGQLRDVQHALRKDIEELDVWLKVVNIWAMPVLVCVIAIVLGVARRSRRRRLTRVG